MACGDETIDTDEGIRTVVGGISVHNSAAGLPRLGLQSPVFPGDPSDPFQRENIMFAPRESGPPDSGSESSAAAWPLVQVWNEPAFVPRGEGSWDDGDASGRSVTNELSITVEVQGAAKVCEGPSAAGKEDLVIRCAD